MENSAANLKLPRFKTVLLNSGGLLYSAWFCFALLFSARISTLIGRTAAVIATPCCTLLAAALVPLAYLAVNKTRSSFWGRYHCVLAATVLIMSLCCAALWNISETWVYGAKVAVSCLCMTALGLGAILLTYIMYSVNARLMGDENKSGLYKNSFQVGGFVIGFALTLLSFYGFSVGDTGYVLACLILAVGGALYFAGVSYIPRFMRPLTRKVTLSSTVKAFFKKPDAVSACSFIAYFLANALCVVFFAFIQPLSAQYGFAANTFVALLSCAVLSGLIAYFWGVRRRLGEYATLVGSILCVLSCLAFVLVSRLVALSLFQMQLTMAAVCAACGFGSGLMLSGCAVRTDKVFKSGKYTPGIFICLKGMVLLAAMGLGIAVCAVLLFIPDFKDIVFVSVLALLGVTAAVMSLIAKRLFVKRLENRLENRPEQDKREEITKDEEAL